MKATWRSEALALLLVALPFALAALRWHDVPARVPVHWSLQGRPDGWAPRAVGLLGPAAMGALLYVVLALAPRLDPGRGRAVAATDAYRLLRLLVLALPCVLQGLLLEAGRGARVDMRQAMLSLLGLLFVALGPVLARLRPNSFAGIRTPWTRASAYAWERTHALGGRAFPACGVAWVALGFVHRAWAAPAAFALLAATAAGLIAYSAWAWHADPGRRRPAG